MRTVWLLPPISDAPLPAHIPPGNVTRLTIRNSHPTDQGVLGSTFLPAGAAVLNETIEIYPGGYDDDIPNNTEVDLETRALVAQLQSMTVSEPEMDAFAIKVYGRLIGQTMAHEIVHSLLGLALPNKGHNVPPIPNDLMNRGSDKTFTQMTGLEDTTHTSPLDPANFIDHGIEAIGGLTKTQALVDARFPVPPAFV